MRRWGSIGLACVVIGLIGWVVVDHSTEHHEVVREKTRTPYEMSKAVQTDRSHPGQEEPVDEPSAAIDTRDAEQRVDNVLDELRRKHEELVAAGATAAARTVHAHIQRLERAQLDRAAGDAAPMTHGPTR